jgi:hypothetical protein
MACSETSAVSPSGGRAVGDDTQRRLPWARLRRKPTLSGALRRFRAPILLSVVMMLDRRRFAVASELFISDNLFGVEQGTDLQMRGQMHRPQATLKLSDGRSLSREAVGRDSLPRACGRVPEQARPLSAPRAAFLA